MISAIFVHSCVSISVFEFNSRHLFDSPFGRLNQFQRWRDLGDLIDLSQRIASTIDNGGYDVVFAHTCMYTFIPVFLQYLETPSVYYLHEPFGRLFYRNIERPYIQTNKRREVLDRFDPLIGLYERRLEAVTTSERPDHGSNAGQFKFYPDANESGIWYRDTGQFLWG